MWQLIFISVGIIFYIVTGYFLFKKWLSFFMQDEEMSSQERLFSGVVLIIATIFWPIVTPFAYLELLNFHLKHRKEIQSLRNKPDFN